MHASRSSTWARIAPIVLGITLSVGMLLTAIVLLAARPASGATPAKTAAPADTISGGDGGFRVRVVEEGSAAAVSSKAAKAARKSAAAGSASEPSAIPTPPEPPEPPDLPDEDVGSSDNDLVRFGEDIEIPADKVIDGDVVAIGGSVTVYGRVKGDCVAIGGAVRIKGSGVVEGDAVSMGGGGVSTSDSGSVAGSNVSLGSWNLDHASHILPVAGVFGAVGTGIWLLVTMIKLSLTLLFAWLALLLARERLTYAVDVMGQRFGKSFLLGLASWAGMVVTIPVAIILIVLVGVIAAAILCITIIGIPVAILLVIAMVLGIIALVMAAVLAGFLAFLNGAMFLGRRVLAKNPAAAQKPLLAILAGLVLLVVLQAAGKLIGIIGLLVFHPIAIALGIAAGALCAVLTTAGLGGILQTGFRAGPDGGAPGSQWWSPFSRRVHTSPAPASPGAGAAAPPTEPPPATPPPPEGGSSDAP
jgi:hypothetical protein